MSTSTAYVNEKNIPDGYYTIKNHGVGSLVALRPGRKDLCGGIRATGENSFVWHVTHGSHGKYIVKSCPDNLVVQCTPAPEENDTVFVTQGLFDWVIRQVSDRQPDCYFILPGRESRLVWSLADSQDGTSVLFAQYSSNPRYWWRFARVTDEEIENIRNSNSSEVGSSQPYDGSSFRSHLPSNLNIPIQQHIQSELDYEPPTFPAFMFGRDDFISTAVDLILNKSPARLAILGPGGVGKTTVAAAIFSWESINGVYHDHKAFVSCEAISSADQLLENLCHGFNANMQQQKPLVVLKYLLSSMPLTLLVLDNFETVWDSDQQNTLKLLKLLDSCRQLTILVTMRGYLRPAASGIRWTHPALEPLQVLTTDAAMHVFEAITQCNDNIGLKKLVESVECLPLAVVLLAHLGQMNISPSELLEMWLQEQTALLSQNNGDKSDCLETSISLSLHSPLMIQNGQALYLLKIICYLPAGVKNNTLPHVAGITQVMVLKATEVLLKTGLVKPLQNGRWKVLSPVRYFILQQYSCNKTEMNL